MAVSAAMPAGKASFTGAKALANPEVSPTPSSVCPTESTAPGEADLRDCDSASEVASVISERPEEEEEEEQWRPAKTARHQSEAKNWSQVGERLRGLFQDLAQASSSEDEDEFDFAASPAFLCVLQPCDGEVMGDAAVGLTTPVTEDEDEARFVPAPAAPRTYDDWQSVGSRLARVLQQEAAEETEDEAEAEPEP
eukprot:gb/GFBE01046348.1/.p1 GENE.gb/GFBE01046348.1/~~gb/GFBE01046348.1/.p1  ORF type:complete len:195 (+),score=46.94 gb/GFBE01046348.1/:1-585(+)